MIIHIGYPRAASTSIEEYMRKYLTVAHADMTDLLGANDYSKYDYVRAESAIDGNTFPDEWHAEKWKSLLYRPGNAEEAFKYVKVDPIGNAVALHKRYPNAKILIVTREHTAWLKSIYRYCVGEMLWQHRSFENYLLTPSGKSHRMAALNEDLIIKTYRSLFTKGVLVLRYEWIGGHTFMAELCDFAGVPIGKLPHVNQSSKRYWIRKWLKP